MLSEQEILLAFPWGKPQEIFTKRGDRLLRKAEPTPDLMAFWLANRNDLASAGVTYGLKWKSQTTYEFCWWSELPKAELAKREENQQLSRATDADIDIPCPTGKAFLPYQRAGVAFILKIWGDSIDNKK